MKFINTTIVPLIGLGWYREKRKTDYMVTYLFINIVILCIKLQLVKRIDTLHTLQNQDYYE